MTSKAASVSFPHEKGSGVRLKKNPKPARPASKAPAGALKELTLSETDVANAQKLLELFGADIRFVEKWGLWLYYKAGSWHRDTEQAAHVHYLARRTTQVLAAEARKALGLLKKAGHQGHGKECDECSRAKHAMSWARNSQFAPRITAMVKIAASDPSVATSHRRLDADPLTLNVLNGTLDLRDGRLRPHTKIDLLTKQAPVAFSTSAKAPRWAAFLNRVLPDPDACGFLQRFLGYCLSGDVSERTFVVLHGGGRNGKSLLLRAVEETLGEYATTAAPALLMAKAQEGHPTEVADLFQVRLAVTSEIKKGRTFDEELVKRVTGNDVLKARRMREDFWGFAPTHKLAIATNHKPKVRDTTDSFWDRLALIEFGERIRDKEVDPKLLDKLRKERSGILLWLLEGWRAYQKEGLARPAVIQESTTGYRHEEDRIGQFFDAECIFVGEKTTLSKTLSDAAFAWCKERGYPPFNPVDLAQRLKERGCSPDRFGKFQARGWRGVGIEKAKPAS